MQKRYVANGQDVVLEADPSLVAVRFREPSPNSMRARVAKEHGLGPFPLRYEIPAEKFTILPVGQGGDRLQSVMAELDAASEVARVAPVFQVGPNRAVATDRVLVGFRPGAPDPKKLLGERGYEIVEQRGPEYAVRLGEYDDPFEVSEQLAGLPDVEYAEPDFVTVGTHIARRPELPLAPASAGDPLASAQYARRLTRADEALQLQAGDREILIAVLDEGVDTMHEDLAPAIAGSYDATDDDTYQEPQPMDAHGTTCAGLAAAVAHNSLGVRGIGAGCGLLAVRIAFSQTGTGDWVTMNSWIVRAIDWSWQNGAAVLSNSWGGSAPSTAVARAFERARTLGRGGLGCVVLAAVGNHDGSVSFPANLPGVLAVAASNQDDEPKTPGSSDNEHWWGSCFGEKVEIAAPGVGNFTTDITGPAGYNATQAPGGNYVPDFNGTSSATPIVAGAAGLVLSANPLLPEAEVRGILCSTADKVGSVPYVGERNDRMGFGRVNVLRAVQRAHATTGNEVHPD